MARGSYVQFDETTSDLSDNAFRVLCYLRHHLVKSNTAYPSIESMSEDLNRSTRTCKRAIAELKSAGFVSVEQAKNGAWEYTIKRASGDPTTVTKMSPRGDKSVTNKVTKMSPSGDSDSDTDSDTDSDKFVLPPTPPYICKETEETEITERGDGGGVSEESKPVTHATAAGNKNLEPFESGLPVRMPDVLNGVKPSRMSALRIAPTQFQQSTIDRIYQVLGTDGDDFAAMVSQDQADAGFVEWILRKAETGKKPIALAVKLLKTSWREGWTNPNAEEDAQYAELVEMMRRIQQ